MWHYGDYRVVIGYDYTFHLSKEQLMKALIRTAEQGELKTPACDKSFLTGATLERIVQNTFRVTTVVLQKRIREMDLEAWCVLSIGHAFCSKKDCFNKEQGRRLAFERALRALKSGRHHDAFSVIYAERIEKRDANRDSEKHCLMCDCSDEGAIDVCRACYNSEAVIANELREHLKQVLNVIILGGQIFPTPWVSDMKPVKQAAAYMKTMEKLNWKLPIEVPDASPNDEKTDASQSQDLES